MNAELRTVVPVNLMDSLSVPPPPATLQASTEAGARQGRVMNLIIYCHIKSKGLFPQDSTDHTYF